MVRLRHKRAVTFGNMRTLQKVHGAKIFDASPIILIFKIIIVFLIFLVATDSFQIYNKAPLPDRDYLFMMDSSSSMANDDINPSRIDAAKTIADNWLGLMPSNTNVGLISFSDEIESDVGLTRDAGEIRDAMDDILINYSHSATSLDYALNYAYDMVSSADAQNVSILLFTDTSEKINENTIEKLKYRNIKIQYFVIGTNWTIESNMSGFDNPSLLAFNFTQIKELVDKTGGNAYKIEDTDEILEVFDDATLITRRMRMKSDLYMLLLVGILSITELVVYARFGGL